MFRRLLPVLALIALLAMPMAALADASPEEIAADINTYWANQLGSSYSPPVLRAVTGPTHTACGDIDPAFGPAAYCSLDSTVYYSPEWAGTNSFIWYIILAHEWGHHIQKLMGDTGPSTEPMELQADCLAGAYVADAEARGFAPAGTFNKGMGLAINAGDLPFDNTPGLVHGSGSQRGNSIMAGYMHGLSACGL